MLISIGIQLEKPDVAGKVQGIIQTVEISN